jgi:CubicO group peptidase (beta-lactamase class C family)
VSSLVPLPAQPRDVPWPTENWPESVPDPDVHVDRLERALERLFHAPPPEDLGETLALLAVHRGRIVLERYGAGHGPDERFISWSMAKSVTHALVGILIGDGALALESPAPVPEWRAPGDPRGAITLEHLLRMVDGLDFVEDYVDAGISHVIDMLFQTGKEDVARYAAARPLAHAPGSVWSYSSGTSNIVARIASDAVGGGRERMLAFMRERLFGPLGMASAEPRFDAAGTFIGSSFVDATARDFARFGLLYLRGGVWGKSGTRVLPPGWVDHARTPTPASEGEYGAHWWLGLGGPDCFWASGYNGQYTIASPARDLVLVRLGLSSADQRERLRPLLADLVAAFPP